MQTALSPGPLKVVASLSDAGQSLELLQAGPLIAAPPVFNQVIKLHCWRER